MTQEILQSKLADLATLMGDLGLPGSVVALSDPRAQRGLWEVRKAGLNIMMSLKGDGKPVSFIEDCAVPLEHLAEYTDALTEVFARHGTHGTWYAHASVGTLHVRPILDMRRDGAAGRRRQNAGDRRGGRRAGAQIPRRLQRRARRWAVPRRMDRMAVRTVALRSLSRHQARARSDRAVQSGQDHRSAAEWTTPRCSALRRPRRRALTAPSRSSRCSIGRLGTCKTIRSPRRTTAPGSGGDNTGGFAKAVEMCNNNGHCRKFDAGTMCPSYRVTRDEQHLTRGRANTLRLALSGQLGPDALTERCSVRGHGSVRRLQGLQARMSDRRRHGEDEDRISGALQGAARLHAQGSHDRADFRTTPPS